MPPCVPAFASWQQAAVGFGYRPLLVLMRREGLTMNHKKSRRLYRGCRCPDEADVSGRLAPGRR